MNSLPINQKLKKLKAPIKAWDKEWFGHIGEKIKVLEAEIVKLDKLADDRDLEVVEQSRLAALMSKAKKWKIKKGELTRQYSRKKNLVEKDNNTGYFHACATLRKKKNHISRVKIDGQFLTKVNDIKRGIIKHFVESFKQEDISFIKLPDNAFKKFSPATVSHLERIPSSEEITKAIWSCDSLKAPRYDDFNLKFVKKFWKLIDDDFISFVQRFFISRKFDRRINVAWVALIPKSTNPQCVDDYKPISMVGCIYKVISKVLENSLKPVIVA